MQRPNCRLRIVHPDPPFHCPRCVVRGIGHFELFALSLAPELAARVPTRWVVADRAAGARAAAQIERTVLWAESRQISVRGELDLASAGALQSVFEETVASGLPCVVLDLSACEFLDAAVLGMIVRAGEQLAANGQELMVQGAAGQVERLIELATAISPEVRLNGPRIAPPTSGPAARPASGGRQVQSFFSLPWSRSSEPETSCPQRR